MTLTAYGLIGNVSAFQWSKMGYYAGLAAGVPQYVTGLSASSGGAGRIISVAAGSGYAANAYADSDASVSVTLAANSSGLSRIDYVVLELDWVALTAAFNSVAGAANASPVAPSLTQTPGTKWQIPIARVTVRNGISTIAAGDIEDCRPASSRSIKYDGTITTFTGVSPSTNRTPSTINIPDPGWPYRILISAVGNIQATNPSATSTGQLYIAIDGDNKSSGRTDFGMNSLAACDFFSDVRSGTAAVVTMVTSTGSIPSGTYSLVGASTKLQAIVIPA